MQRPDVLPTVNIITGINQKDLNLFWILDTSERILTHV